MEPVREYLERRVNEKFNMIEDKLRNSFREIRRDNEIIKDKISALDNNIKNSSYGRLLRELDRVKSEMSKNHREILDKINKEIGELRNNEVKKNTENIKSIDKELRKDDLKGTIRKDLQKEIDEKLKKDVGNLKEIEKNMKKDISTYKENISSSMTTIVNERDARMKEIEKELATLSKELKKEISEISKKGIIYIKDSANGKKNDTIKEPPRSLKKEAKKTEKKIEKEDNKKSGKNNKKVKKLDKQENFFERIINSLAD